MMDSTGDSKKLLAEYKSYKKMGIELHLYPNYPVLQNDEILMRQVLRSDIPNVVELTYYDAKPAVSVDEAIIIQDRINKDFEAGDCFHWIIIDKATDIIVGTCSYHGGFVEETGELGCVMKAAYRGQGYMTKALLLAIDFGFNELKLSKIIAVTTLTNSRAIALLGRIGFQQTKVLENDNVLYERMNTLLNLPELTL